MSSMNKSKAALWAIVILAAVGIGAVGGYQFAGTQKAVVSPVDDTDKPNTPEPQEEPGTNEPKPTEPKPGDGGTDQPKPQEPVQEPSGDAIEFKVFGGGSGSLDLDTAAYSNNSFQLERVEWSEASGSIFVSGKMRAFEAVGYMRVRDEHNKILEPESVIRAREGAPAWSGIKGEIPLNPDYEGRVLYVEFFVKSMNDGSRYDIVRLPIKPI